MIYPRNMKCLRWDLLLCRPWGKRDAAMSSCFVFCFFFSFFGFWNQFLDVKEDLVRCREPFEDDTPGGEPLHGAPEDCVDDGVLL